MLVKWTLPLAQVTGTGLCVLLLAFGTGCQEKKSTAPAVGSDTGSGSGSGSEEECEEEDEEDCEDGEGSGDGSGTGTTSGSGTTAEFDLCDSLDGEMGSNKLVGELCDDGLLAELRSNYVYTGGENKFKEVSEIGETTSTMKLYSVANYSASVEDYWAMIQLQQKKPAEFRDAGFKYDVNAKLSEVEASDDSVTFKYLNDGEGEGGAVDYRAKTTFTTLKEGQAYVSSTVSTEGLETITSLKGLIIVNKISNSKVEVVTVSEQAYEHATKNEGNALKSKAINGLKDEQKRGVDNAAKAEEAADLL